MGRRRGGIIAASALVLTGMSGVSSAQADNDLWNYDRSTIIDGHSPFDSDQNQGYDARDIFGGAFTVYEPERGDVVFTDGFGSGTVHWVEWTTARPVNVERIDAYLWGDSVGKDWRHTQEFRVYARADASQEWGLMLDVSQTRDEALARNRWNISEEIAPPAEGMQLFRAEFVQLSNDPVFGGPRVIEVDGFGTVVPCAGDFNADGEANILDVLLFLNAWNAQDPSADFNGDGVFDSRDVLAFLNAWVAGC